jgi:hypothetical protein
MDHGKLKKPDHIKEHIWQRHLRWMELVGKQAEENIKQRQKQINNNSDSHRQQ